VFFLGGGFLEILRPGEKQSGPPNVVAMMQCAPTFRVEMEDLTGSTSRSTVARARAGGWWRCGRRSGWESAILLVEVPERPYLRRR